MREQLPDEYLTAEQAGKLAGLCTATIRRAMRSQQLRSVKVPTAAGQPRLVRTTRAWVHEWLTGRPADER